MKDVRLSVSGYKVKAAGYPDALLIEVDAEDLLAAYSYSVAVFFPW